MERYREVGGEEGFYLPDTPEETRRLAATKLTDASEMIFSSDINKMKESERLKIDAEKLEMHAFDLSQELEDYEMMGVSVASAVEIRFQLGNYAGAKKLARFGLKVIGDRAPEFSDRLEDTVKKIENVQKVNE